MNHQTFTESAASSPTRILNLAVVASALGYFVDIFDLFLFGIVRVPSLTDLGYSGGQLLEKGVFLLNNQMLGVLLGGIFWGVLGDKLGRVSVLFGSILLYSVANIANGFVHTIEAYGVWRFIAGFGLAGELGLAITLVSETLPKGKRGYGTTIVASVGICGTMAASLISQYVSWRTAFVVGGCLGLLLLALRVKLHEPALFKQARADDTVSRGNFFLLFAKRERFQRYLNVVLIGVPIWFTVATLITFAPEFAETLGIQGSIVVGHAVFYTYIGGALGDFTSGIASQLCKSRRGVLAAFLAILGLAIALFLFSRNTTPFGFYSICVLLGFATGYWTVFVTTAAELFGTNLRSTVATTAPNFVRGASVPITIAFLWLKPKLGLINSALLLGSLCLALAFWAVWRLKETFETNLDFLET